MQGSAAIEVLDAVPSRQQGAAVRMWWQTPRMVSAIYYLALAEDQAALLDYLGEPAKVTLHPWWTVDDPIVSLTRQDALRMRDVMIARPELGGPIAVRPGDPAMEERSRSGVFNRFNWDRIQPTGGGGLVDSNSSPVLLWRPASTRSARSESVTSVRKRIT